MNIDYDNELNQRLSSRVIPSTTLRPQYDIRPVSTKYAFFQTTEERPAPTENLHQYVDYSTTTVFNPGSRGPTDFYLKSIDQESRLRNQFMALQKADQAVYVPEINSDLYQTKTNTESVGKGREYSSIQIGSRQVSRDLDPDTFHNSTRVNMRK